MLLKEIFCFSIVLIYLKKRIDNDNLVSDS
jgi:hypothetical protein